MNKPCRDRSSSFADVVEAEGKSSFWLLALSLLVMCSVFSVLVLHLEFTNEIYSCLPDGSDSHGRHSRS